MIKLIKFESHPLIQLTFTFTILKEKKTKGSYTTKIAILQWSQTVGSPIEIGVTSLLEEAVDAHGLHPRCLQALGDAGSGCARGVGAHCSEGDV